MCGFAGYLNLTNKQFSIDQSALEQMQRALRHRGPDGKSSWSSAEHELALVHCRLSIVDLSAAAAQPMTDRQKRVVLCANGEIYNHQLLRNELIALGHQFSSHSDCEVIIHGYKQWGIDALLERLDGMFAFSLYDVQTRELFLVRDRIGVKPLYFAQQGGVLSFASEIKAFWPLPWMQRNISPQAANHYLTYLATPAPLTIYQDVYKLPAGFYVRIDARKQLHIKQWYKLHEQLRMPAPQDEQYHIDTIRDMLRTSIKKRMMSDVPFGVFLSGGIDSSLNVALMSELTDRVKTFTVAFSDGPEYNELAWARKVAERYGTDHHEVMIDESDALTFFNKMVYHQDEPLGDCVCVPIYFVSELLKKSGVTVVQVGEGSDELFCGYDAYARYVDAYRWWQPTQRMVPTVAKKGMFYAAQRLFGSKFGKLDMLNNWAGNRELFFSGAVVFGEYLKQHKLQMHHAGAQDHMIEQFFPEMQLSDSYAMADWYRRELKQAVPDADLLTHMGYLELRHRLPELLLMRVDKMSMATSVEARVPFLDHRLVAYALTIPVQFKYRNGVTKYILKKAAEGILPNDVIYRKKMGFAAPTTRWFKHGTRFNELLADQLASKHPLADHMDFSALQQMQQQNKSDTSVDYSYQLWAVQNLLAIK